MISECYQIRIKLRFVLVWYIWHILYFPITQIKLYQGTFRSKKNFGPVYEQSRALSETRRICQHLRKPTNLQDNSTNQFALSMKDLTVFISKKFVLVFISFFFTGSTIFHQETVLKFEIKAQAELRFSLVQVENYISYLSILYFGISVCTFGLEL
jgi:hypothetical protein